MVVRHTTMKCEETWRVLQHAFLASAVMDPNVMVEYICLSTGVQVDQSSSADTLDLPIRYIKPPRLCALYEHTTFPWVMVTVKL